MSKSRRTFLSENEKGYTLVIALMVIMVFSVLGLSLMATSMNSVKMSAGEREDQSVFYIAEAALNTEMAIIDQKVNEAYRTSTSENSFYNNVLTLIRKNENYSTAKFEKVSNFTPEAKVTVEEMNKENPREYRITSTGFIDNKKRTVEQKFSIEWQDTGNGIAGTAISVKNDILLDGKVTGNIVTSKKSSGSVSVGWDTVNSHHFDDTIYVPTGYKGSALVLKSNMNFKSKIEEQNEGFSYVLPSFPKFPSHPAIVDIPYNYNSPGSGSKIITLNKNSAMGILNVGGSHTLIINVTGTEKELIVDELHLGGTGKIIINGTGKLKIFVKNKLNLTNGILNPKTQNEDLWAPANLNGMEDHLKKLEIYYKGTDEFSVNSKMKIYASIYAETANISIASSAGIFGNIFSGGSSFKVTGTGNIQPSLYFAPHADFEVSGSGKVQGTIIGNSIKIFGGGRVDYKPFLINEGLFNPEFGSSGDPNVKKKKLIEL